MKEKEMLSIGEVSRVIGVTEKTLRIWDEIGKLKSERTEGGHRRYDPEAVRRLILDGLGGDIETISDEVYHLEKAGHDRHACQDTKFWEEKGLLSEQDEDHKVLAVLLSNQALWNKIKSNDHLLINTDCCLHILRKLWNKLTVRNLIPIHPMLVSAILHYFTEYKNNNNELLLNSESISYKNENIDVNLLLPEVRQDYLILLEKETFCPIETKINNPIAFQNELDYNWVIDWNADKIADALNSMIVKDLWKNADVIFDYKKALESKNYNYILTNNFGIEMLRKNFDFSVNPYKETETTLVGEIFDCKVYHNNSVDGFLLGSKTPCYLNSPYCFYFYVPIVLGPPYINDEGNRDQKVSTQFARVFRKNPDYPLSKIVF